MGAATVWGFIGDVRCVCPSGIRQIETDEEVRDDARLGLMQTDSGLEPSSKASAVLRPPPRVRAAPPWEARQLGDWREFSLMSKFSGATNVRRRQNKPLFSQIFQDRSEH